MTRLFEAAAAAFFGIAILGIPHGSEGRRARRHHEGKVIKVAVPQDFAPFGSAGPDLKPQGYDIDMANLIAKELGVKAEIIPVTSANRIPYLQTKKADLVISSLGKNPEREKVIDFSIAYAPFFSGVYGTKAIAVAKIEDLAGKTVGATRGAIEEQELSKTAPPTHDGQALRGQQRHHRGLHLRPGRPDRHRQHGRRLDRREERRPAPPVLKFVIKD